MTTTDARRMVTSPLVLLPAYGRTYATAEAMHKDWCMGKDFRIVAGPYCSIRDLERLQADCSSLWLYDPASRNSIRVG